MEKLNFFGAGPKIGSITIPWLAITIVLTLIRKELFSFSAGSAATLRLAGFVVLGLGLVLYFITVRVLLKGLKETKLVTTGGFFLCQNPLYASLIVLIIPGIALIMNSWLVITASIIGYIMFKIHIRSEYSELERIFGESYKDYKNKTPEFFPFPIKKIFGWKEQK
jgi:protein-S-isoprenylcysteine O-methyltransferase Ste14